MPDQDYKKRQTRNRITPPKSTQKRKERAKNQFIEMKITTGEWNVAAGVCCSRWSMMTMKVERRQKENREREKSGRVAIKKAGSTSSFPSGPPPQYSSCLKLFNFGVRTGSGAFSLVWPTAKTYPTKSLKYPLSTANFPSPATRHAHPQSITSRTLLP